MPVEKAMNDPMCQKCFEGPVGQCACVAQPRPWEPPATEVRRRPQLPPRR